MAAPPSLPRDSPVNFDDLDDLAYEDALGDSFEFDGIEPPDDVEIVPGAAGIASGGLPMPEALAAPSTPPTTNVAVPLTPSTERSCPASNYSGFSLTVTPCTRVAGMAIDRARLQEWCMVGAARLLQHFTMLAPLGEVNGSGESNAAFFCTPEEGSRHHNFHLQGCLSRPNGTTVKNVHEEVRRTLTLLPSEWLDIKYIVIVKLATSKGGWLYLCGYVQKDHALAHYAPHSHGFDGGFFTRALDYYLSMAGRTAFTSNKLNLCSAEEMARRKCEIDNRNIFYTLTNFMIQHRLSARPSAPSAASLQSTHGWLRKS